MCEQLSDSRTDLDRAVCSTAASPVGLSQPPPPPDTRRLLPGRTDTSGAATRSRRRSSGSRVTTGTRGKGRLGTRADLSCGRPLLGGAVARGGGAQMWKQTHAGRSATVSRVSLRSVTVGPVVPGRRVDAGVSSDLRSLTTGGGAVRPHRPRGPTAVHWHQHTKQQ